MSPAEMSGVKPRPGDAGEPVLVTAPACDDIARARRRRRALITIVIAVTLLIVISAFEGLIAWESDRQLTVLLAVAGAVLAVIALAGVLIRDTNRHSFLLERREASFRDLAAGLERCVAWRTRSLTELNRQLDAALSASGVTVFTQDNDLVYTWISNAAFGFTPEAIIGRSDDDLIGAKWHGSIRALKRKVVDTGETARAEVSVQEADIERWYALTVEVLRDSDDATCGIIGGAVDITDRREHETRIDLLMSELTHRSRNLLSVIQAMRGRARPTAGRAMIFSSGSAPGCSRSPDRTICWCATVGRAPRCRSWSARNSGTIAIWLARGSCSRAPRYALGRMRRRISAWH
jgi:PAS domain S-box-containing protein